jgi:predicted outer membrane repeat protein
LRAAADEGNALASSSTSVTLTVDPVLSIPGAGDDANLSGDIDFRRSAGIAGQGHTIDGAHLDRVLESTQGDIALSKVTVTGGAPPIGDGGGVFAPLGTINVTDSTIRDNRTSVADPNGSLTPLGFGAAGGGLNAGVAINVTRSTVEDNVAGGTNGVGGGASGGVNAVRSAFIGNQATGEGGAIFDGATVTVSTVSQNTAPVGAATSGSFAFIDQSTVTDNVGASQVALTLGGEQAFVQWSVVAGTSPGCASGVVFQLNDDNFSTDGSCRFLHSGADVRLSQLGLHGGTTANQVPAADSPLIDAIDDCQPPRGDQRGFQRSGVCDAGSIERQPSDP